MHLTIFTRHLFFYKLPTQHRYYSPTIIYDIASSRQAVIIHGGNFHLVNIYSCIHLQPYMVYVSCECDTSVFRKTRKQERESRFKTLKQHDRTGVVKNI